MIWVAGVMALWACDDDDAPMIDARVVISAPDALLVDAAAVDATTLDAAVDAATVDAAAVDAATVDAAALDAAAVDAEPAIPDAMPQPDALLSDAAPDVINPPFADTDFCHEVEGFGPVFASTVARWAAQDDLSAPAPGALLLVGSSSVRCWEHFAVNYAGYQPLQRGFGGAQLGEIALFAEDLVIRHRPAAIAVFAGTNDVAAGVSADVVIQRFRCLRQRVGHALGWQVPILWIAITPTPSRWATWDVAHAVNQGIEALRAEDLALFYVDVASPFLETGRPPASRLFVEDMLHLSPEGYALWDAALRQQVQAAMRPLSHAAPNRPPLAPGARLRVDLGPDNAEDGERTPSPDYLGAHWNNWHSLAGDGEALAGEHLDDLVTTDGAATPIDLFLTGGFKSNGRAHGGLLWPTAQLGDLAVGSATGDFLYTDGPDMPGGFAFRGLDPAARYTLRFFASRAHPERRVTEYHVTGAGVWSGALQTSGPGAGTAIADGNDDDVLALTDLQPDPWGQLFVDVIIAEGSYGYLSIVEIEAQ
ncbi:hypothetical protein KKF91_08605 [Myxococcota bacterium]|nr:hypothetical protein [Myxococcota bacterium]